MIDARHQKSVNPHLLDRRILHMFHVTSNEFAGMSVSGQSISNKGELSV